jgi:hypothetical protein
MDLIEVTFKEESELLDIMPEIYLASSFGEFTL